MANEITVVGATEKRVNLLFLFPLTPKVDVNAAPIVPTPAVGVGMLHDGTDPISAADRTALDAGTMMYEMISYSPPDGESAPDALTKVRAMYAGRVAVVQAEYDAKNLWASRVGQRFNAV